MTAVILTDTTTGATAPSDDSISVVEINTAVINSSGDAFDFDSTENSSVIVAGIIATILVVIGLAVAWFRRPIIDQVLRRSGIA